MDNKSTQPKLNLVKNNLFSSTYNESELSDFSERMIDKVYTFQKTHESYSKTPLFTLSNLAKYFRIADLKVKDESFRFGLNAFKVLGGIYAIGKYVAELLNKEIEELSFSELQTEKVKKQLGQLTFISATDGNHGKGVAWAARELGQKAIIYLPKGSAEIRRKAIENEGATAKISDVNYDQTVQLCADLAEKNGWIMVQDTAWEGYEKIPLWIMQGYATIAKEVMEEMEVMDESPPTHIFLQAGVGSFAASITAYFTEIYREKAPMIILLEPHEANCYYRSFANGKGDMEIVTGDLNSIMAGLCCGAPNTRAFRLLSQYATASFSLDDRIAALGMRVLGNPLKDDPKIISGESGACTTIGLLEYLVSNECTEILEELEITNDSRILCINTEGDTDREHYREIVWEGTHTFKE